MDLLGLIPQFGGFLYTALSFVIALSIIVTVHEFGHYIVGRWSGIHAEVFSIGFGPKLMSRVDRHGTRWQIAALPFGGYVKFLGDANAASAGADDRTMARLSDAERRHTMHGAPLWARAATVAAGPVFNFILSILVFAAFFIASGRATDIPTVGSLQTLPGGTGEIAVGDEILAVGGIATPDYRALTEAVDKLPSADVVDYRVKREGAELTVAGPALYPPRASSIAPGSAAMDAGLQRGDVVTAVGGMPVHAFADIQAAVKAADGAPLDLTVWRSGQTFDVTLAPRRTDLPLPEGGFETRFLIGLTGEYFFAPATEPVGPLEALPDAARQTWFIVTSSISGIGHMISGAISSCNLRGPLGIAETSGAAASQGLADFIWFIAVLSTAVGMLNLFPIPVLDGGHLVFHAWEWATGKPPSDRVMNAAMAIGFAIVLSLMAFGLTNDIFCP